MITLKHGESRYNEVVDRSLQILQDSRRSLHQHRMAVIANACPYCSALDAANDREQDPAKVAVRATLFHRVYVSGGERGRVERDTVDRYYAYNCFGDDWSVFPLSEENREEQGEEHEEGQEHADGQPQRRARERQRCVPYNAR